MTKLMPRFWPRLIFTLCFCFFMLGALPAAAEEAAETVRVGVYPLAGFHSFAQDGSCVGYDVDYLNRISNVTGWQYKYVMADSWADAEDKLRKGEIDLLAPCLMTADTMAEFSFTTLPIGKVYAALLTLNDSNLVYEDFEAFDAFSGTTFGIEAGNSFSAALSDYAQANHFTPSVKIYPNHYALVAALRAGDVDAIVASIMLAENDMRLLGKASAAQFYYMYRKSDVELGTALNNALDQIEIDEPNFQNDLESSYFPLYNEEPFSRAELSYAENLPVIRVACTADARPYSFIDPTTGAATGILVDYLRTAGAAVGLQYEFVPFTTDPDAETLQKQNIQLMVECGVSPLEKSRSDAAYTNDFLDTQQLIVCAPGVNYALDAPLSITRFSMVGTDTARLSEHYPSFTWLVQPSTIDCLEAVHKREADGCLVNQYAANWYLAMPRYSNLEMVTNSSVSQPLCLRSGSTTETFDPTDTTFIRLLNKSFKQISDIEVQQITIRYTTAMPYQLTASETLYKYRFVVFVLAAMVMVLTCGLVALARNRARRARRDGLTGLYNRGAAKLLISRMLHNRQQSAGALVMLDLDHFKEVNDTLGHQAGDRLLTETADALTASCRAGDVVCRLGGDEFLIYLPSNAISEFLPNKLAYLCRRLNRTARENGKTVRVSCSIGVAVAPADGCDFDTLYKHADEALYRTKENGRNGVTFYADPV